MGTVEVHAGFWWGNLREGDHLEDLGVDRRIILKWILEEWKGEGLDRSCSG
jgi:hypothetical protein